MTPEITKALASGALQLIQRANLTVQEINGVQQVQHFLQQIANGQYEVKAIVPVDPETGVELAESMKFKRKLAKTVARIAMPPGGPSAEG